MLLQKSLRNLIAKSGASAVRFWGKIKGTKADYFVVEATQEGGGAEGEEGGEAAEPRGTGANQFVYWVTNSPVGEWSQLPDIKPSQIIKARQIKCMFTGNLKEKIYTNPFYFEEERIYLRAQIARINSSCTIVPKGLHRFVEDSTRDIEDNTPEEGEIVKPTTKQMCNIDMWVHHTPSLLKQGRTKHADPKPKPGEEELEPEVLMAREVEKDPWEPRLKQIAKDNATRGGMPPWILRSFNAETDLVDPKTGKANVNFGTVVVKSMWWPGSCTLYNSGRTIQVYNGDGQKNEPANASYYPVQPPRMMTEKAEKQCFFDPRIIVSSRTNT